MPENPSPFSRIRPIWLAFIGLVLFCGCGVPGAFNLDSWSFKQWEESLDRRLTEFARSHAKEETVLKMFRSDNRFTIEYETAKERARIDNLDRQVGEFIKEKEPKSDQRVWIRYPMRPWTFSSGWIELGFLKGKLVFFKRGFTYSGL